MKQTLKWTLIFTIIALLGYAAYELKTREKPVAIVFDQPITQSQLARALHEKLRLDGTSIKSLIPEKRQAARNAALNDLIDQEILRAKAANFKVTEHEIEARFKEFSTSFKSPEEMLTAMKSQGIANPNDLRSRLATRIQQEKYVESKLAPLTSVAEDEARKWFDENHQHLGLPERINVCHLFIATLDRPQAEAKAKLDTALADLTSQKKTFDSLAKELSEDESNKNRGGSLGWMTRDRLPADFTASVFALPLHQASLVRTKLGWHLVEITDRKPATARSFEEAKTEVVAALEAIKRHQAAENFRKSLRRSEAANIKIFPE